MDRLLTWDDLEVHPEGTEGRTIPPELADEIGKRSQAFVMMTGETFDQPLELISFSAYKGGRMRGVVLRESDLHGTVGGNLDSIIATCPEKGTPPDLLVRRGRL